MTNFIFKSSTTLKKLANKLDALLNEQRCQRSDLKIINDLLQHLVNDKRLQETVDKYYKEAPDFASPE